MPKKTKKQKLRAEERHHDVSTESVAPVVFNFRAEPQNDSKNIEEVHELAAIRSDLTRTIVLAIMAISIELVVYWRFFST